MSAMSASPVKPVLPPTGVNVPPPVATSPPKVGMMQIPATPSKPASMNHTTMPLSLITEKLPQQYTPPNQPGIPPSMPISQPLPRTPEKPKDLTAPVAMLMKPTSNGMEGLGPQNQPNPPSLAIPAVPDVQVSAVLPLPQKAEVPVAPEVLENNASQTQTLPENTAEPSPASAAPPVEPDMEKKVEPVPPKPSESVSKVTAATPQPQSVPTPASVPVPQPQEATPAIPVPAPVPAVPTSAPAIPTAAAATAPSTTATAPPSTPAPCPTQAPPPPAEQPVAPSVSRTETSLPHAKPELKVATIPRQATKRKREPKVVPETPEVKKEGKDEDRKSKRVRLPTQPYQSPLPELNIIAKINKSSKSTPTKAADDKLIVFYKNEFLAVRNAEGGFYVCQAMQNIYKSSPRIRIRWLSQEEGKDTYSPDFYDHTDFDCILTNLNLDKIDKEKFRLPAEEQQRTESILKRALDVEKGVSEKPPVTEEHPDGLDLSLFRDESQLKKSSKNKSGKRSVKSDGGESSSNEDEDEAEDEDDDEEEEDEEEEAEEEEKETVKKTPPKTSKRKKKISKKKAPPPSEKKAAAAKSATSNNKSTVTPAKKKTETRVGSKRKSPVSSNTQPPEKKTRKSETSSQPSDRTNKTRSAGTEAVVGVKSRRDRRAKSRK